MSSSACVTRPGIPHRAEDIAGHLLDRVLPAAYTPQPGEPPPRYDLPTAERALRRIATRMNKDGTRDLQWWHVPAWAHAAPRVIATWLGAALVVGLVFGLVAGLAVGLAVGLAAGLAVGLAAGIAAGIAFGRGNKIPKRIAPVRWRQLFRRRPLVVGLLAGTRGRARVVRLCNVPSGRLGPGLRWARARGRACGLARSRAPRRNVPARN